LKEHGANQYLLILIAVFLLSFTHLSFEILLTRILSMTLTYHFVFFAISLAMLGTGLGGLVTHLCTRNNKSFKYIMGSFAFLYTLSLPLTTLLFTTLSKTFLINTPSLIAFVFFFPFLFIGALFSGIFRIFSERSAFIYGSDLAGAALGSIGVIFMGNLLGIIHTEVIIIILALLSSLIIMTSFSKPHKYLASGTLLFTLVILIAFALTYSPSFLIHKFFTISNPTKEIYQTLQDSSLKGKLIRTIWSSFGRTDVVHFEPRPNMMHIYIDGTAGSPMYYFSGNINNPGEPAQKLVSNFSGNIPLTYLDENEKDTALIIGPGGGRDVLLALLHKFKKITAVEVNKDILEVLREFSWFNGGIIEKFENIQFVHDEGRSFLHRQNERYDLIMLSLPITASIRTLDAFSLTENYLFTTDSIQDYLNHLTPEGQVVVVCHGDFEIARLFSLVLTNFSRQGISIPQGMKHIVMIKSPSYPVFILKNQPFSPARIKKLLANSISLKIDLNNSYFPYFMANEKSIFTALAKGKISLVSYIKKIEEQGLDISPVTDNNPFFYKYQKGLPPNILNIFLIGIVIFIPTLIALTFFINKSLLNNKKERINQSSFYLSTIILLFFLIGIGFIMIEVSLIQKFILFLGQPVNSMAITLFSLLLGTGLGSFLSRKISSFSIPKAIYMSSMVTFCLTLVILLSSPVLFESFLNLPFLKRIMITSLILLPLGIGMGFCFPLGIKLLSNLEFKQLIPWVWAINGISSVLGSSLTLIIAIKRGFSYALWGGALCYFLIFLIFFNFRYQRQ